MKWGFIDSYSVLLKKTLYGVRHVALLIRANPWSANCSMASRNKRRPQTLSFQDQIVWTTKLPDVTFAVLPPSNTRPNPLATEDRLYVSVFSPGAVCALERDGGKLIWRKELPKFGNASVYLHNEKLFSKTANALFALDPDSGEALWSFCPYGTDGESIYSSPLAHANRVYIGDRRGYLHCLDVDSGATIWKQGTNDAGGNVNSTPVLLGDLVIVTTNAKTAVAYEALSGKLAWKQDLDGPSTFGPVLHKNSVLAVSDSLYVLDPTSGKVQRRLSWSGRKVHQAASTPQSIIVMIHPEISHVEISAANEAAMTAASSEARSKTAMCVISHSGKERQTQIAAFCPQFRYATATRLVYLSHLGGVDIFRPATGALLCRLATSGDTGGGIGLVDLMNEKIYVLTGDGTVYALRHPADLL